MKVIWYFCSCIVYLYSKVVQLAVLEGLSHASLRAIESFVACRDQVRHTGIQSYYVQSNKSVAAISFGLDLVNVMMA